MKYKATFTGCELGAIGIHYKITTEVEGDSEESARLALHDRYDHIIQLKLEEMPEVFHSPV